MPPTLERFPINPAASAAHSQLVVLFPHADPGFVEACIAHWLSQSPPPDPYTTSSPQAWTAQALVERRTAPEPGGIAEIPQVRKAFGRRSSGKAKAAAPPPPAAAAWRGPEGPRDDVALARNLALVRLHAMFPLVSIPDLRDVVLAQPHSVLFAAAETLIERSLTPSKRATQPVFGADLLEAAVSALSRFFSSGVNGDDATSNRARPSKKGKERALGALDTSTDPVLTPHDLFHCPAYESALVAHFESLFPALAPLSSAPIERVVHRESGSYASMRERLERAAAEIEDERDRPWWSRWIGGSAGSARASGSTTAMGASLKRRGLVGKSANSSGRREVDPLIRSEVEAYERAQLGPPPPHAVETAVEQSGSAGAPLVECQCCFSPVPYAATHLACCSDPVAPASPPSSSPDPSVPPHFFCRDCVKAYVRTFTFGGTPLPAIALETSALPCISAAGPSPCVRVFSRRELSQTLDRTLATALASQITSATLERLALPPSASSASGSKLLRCPFCPYAELADPLPGALARVFLPAWVAEPFPPSLAQILVTLTGSVVLLLLLLLAGILALVTPARRLERTYDALHPADAGLGQRSLLGLPERLLLAPHHLPALCASRAVNPSAPSLHVCRASVSASTATTEPASEQEQAEESLRLAVERAMSDAVKRDCGRCGAALQKETGNGACNKVVCRCGFIYCHSCRREIPSWQGYGHFCPHPRDPDRVRRPDEPTCDRCDKCSLWDEPDEGQRVRKAVEQARLTWAREHPAWAKKVDLETPVGFEPDAPEVGVYEWVADGYDALAQGAVRWMLSLDLR
ncbi:hypothetical protein DMC30DRAFT_415572 [Rhodotorula diobovata]|uniref:RING-type domain-containing protein n=1 Tax=Rhodotorula diobovata TaxID=5288 RepID=A0A5C5FZ41_9BASI|nr:hypothetical protein DMC30DRAFT_415572 [Rhodotorula diobovata]